MYYFRQVSAFLLLLGVLLMSALAVDFAEGSFVGRDGSQCRTSCLDATRVCLARCAKGQVEGCVQSCIQTMAHCKNACENKTER